MNFSLSLSFGGNRKSKAPVVENRYEGAQSSPKRSDLPVQTRPARFDVTKVSRNKLAEKADYFFKNSPVLSGIVRRMATLVIGTGIVPIPASSNPAWNERAERVWRNWARHADLTSRATYGQLQKMWYMRQLITGENFRSHTYGPSGRPRLQTFDFKQICSEIAGSYRADEGDGITYDRFGRASTYRVVHDYESNKSIPISAEFIVHDFELVMPGQKRGVTILAPGINTAHNIDDILVLEQDALKHLSTRRDVIKKKSGEMDPEGMRKENWEQEEGKNVEAAGSTTTNDEYYRAALGSETLVLQPEDDYALVIPDRPSTAWQGFMEFLTFCVCMPIGMPPSMLLQIKVGGADTRRDGDIAGRVIETHQDAMLPGLQRDYEYVIGAEIEDGSLKGAPADWREVDWQCPRAITMDAGRRDTSDRRAVAMGLYPFQDYWGEMGVGNWRRQLRKNGEFAREVKKVATDFEVAESAVFNPSVENFKPEVQFTQEPKGDAQPAKTDE